MISFGFMHRIRYSTETTQQLASEGSGQTSQAQCQEWMPLLNLHTLPALLHILHTLYNQLSLLQPRCLPSHLPSTLGKIHCVETREGEGTPSPTSFHDAHLHSQWSQSVHLLSRKALHFSSCQIRHILPQKSTLIF